MKTQKALPPIIRIVKYTLTDEVRQKSFVIMFVICAMFVFLIRGCYQGNYMVNGQLLDAGTVVRAVSKVTFHVIAAGVMGCNLVFCQNRWLGGSMLLVRSSDCGLYRYYSCSSCIALCS